MIIIRGLFSLQRLIVSEEHIITMQSGQSGKMTKRKGSAYLLVVLKGHVLVELRSGGSFVVILFL